MAVFIRNVQREDFDHIFSLLQQLWCDKDLSKSKLEKIFMQTLCSEKDFGFCAVDGEKKRVCCRLYYE
ncbi:hypothetical protein [Lacrimispora brassicae]